MLGKSFVKPSPSAAVSVSGLPESNFKGNFLLFRLFLTLIRGHARDRSVIVESHQEWLAWVSSKGKH